MTRRPVPGERTVNGIRTLRASGPCRSGEVALHGDDAGGLAVPHDVADEGLALLELLVAGLARTPRRPRPTRGLSRSSRSARSSMRAGTTGPWVHSSAASPWSISRRRWRGALCGAASYPSSDSPARVRRRRRAATAYGRTVSTHRTEGELTTRRTPYAVSSGTSAAARSRPSRSRGRAGSSPRQSPRGDRLGVADEDERPRVEAVGLLEPHEREQLVAGHGRSRGGRARPRRRARRPRRSR